MTNKATVHLMCGLPGSGKTTLAKKIAQERPALRFTLDVWMMNLYDHSIYDPAYGLCVERCQTVIWETGRQALTNGLDIVLDWSLWSKERRQTWRERIEEAGFQHQLYYFNIPLPLLQTRLHIRNQEPTAGVHYIEAAELIRFSGYFKPPTLDEGFNIIEIKP
jgi:predicted kinase